MSENAVHLRVLQFSDLHLDAPFDGLSEDKSALARDGLRAAFDGMMSKIRECDIRLVLIPGDLFDNRYVTNGTAEMLIREMRSCPETTFVIAPGKADLYAENPIYASGRLPANCHVFSGPMLSSFDLDEFRVTVYGWAYHPDLHGECPLRDRHVENSSRINIVCAYADLDGKVDGDECLVSSEDLKAFGADFYAFGSRHDANTFNTVGSAVYAYSGAPTSTGFDNVGKGDPNYVVMDLEDGNISINLKPIPFDGLRLYNDELDITGVDTKSEIINRMAGLINEKHYGAKSAIRLSLVGDVDPHFAVPQNFESETFGLFYFRVEDKTLPLYGTDHFLRDMTAAGEIYRKLLPYMKSENEEERLVSARAFRVALMTLEGKNTDL